MGRSKDNSKRQVEEVRLLKKRIKSLERENAKLRKDIRSGRAFPMPEEAEPEQTVEKEVPDKEPENMVKCKCGKNAQLVVLSKLGVPHNYIFCSSCKRRELLGK